MNIKKKYKSRLKHLSEHLKDTRGGRVLDVATGHGGSLYYLLKALDSYDEAIGIDVSAKILDRAREKIELPDVSLVEMDAARLTYEDDYFDTVFICNSLHHVPDLKRTLGEMKRVLKPGGLFLLSEMYQDPGTERDNSYHHIHHWWAEVDRLSGISHRETMLRDDLTALTEALGLSEISIIDIDNPQLSADDETIKLLVSRCEQVIEKLKTKSDSSLTKIIERGEELIQIISKQGTLLDKEFFLKGRK